MNWRNITTTLIRSQDYGNDKQTENECEILQKIDVVRGSRR